MTKKTIFRIGDKGNGKKKGIAIIQPENSLSIPYEAEISASFFLRKSLSSM